MKGVLGLFLPGLAVMLAAGGSAEAHQLWLQLVLAMAAWAILTAFFVQKYPKVEPLKWIARSLAKGENIKVEIEGK